jgi:clan AA aspartic protease
VGVFTVSVEIGDPEGEQFRSLDLVVDTGASHTSLPASLLRQLGVRPHDRQRFMMADGRIVESDVGRTWIRIDGHAEVTIVVFAEEDTQPLLGAITLEEFGLGVDPVGRRLMPVVKYRLTQVRAND